MQREKQCWLWCILLVVWVQSTSSWRSKSWPVVYSLKHTFRSSFPLQSLTYRGCSRLYRQSIISPLPSIIPTSTSSVTATMSYKQLLRQLFQISVYTPVKTGLENMMKLHSLLGYPLQNVPIVHVTGTNGKGSVAFKVARALTASGIRTGLFTSPHISSFTERIQVNHDLISEEEVESILPHLFQLCQEHDIPATFFEITTALAMVQFQRKQCEAVVLEVGIGGRLDSTNIISPALSVLTTVQLDHMGMLGDTIEKIAKEKAGIIKHGADALIGPGCPLEVMRERAIEVGTNLFTVPEVLNENEYFYQGLHHRPLSQDGQQQQSELHEQPNILADTEVLNTDIARAALRLLTRSKYDLFRDKIDLNGQRVRDSLLLRPPCRYEEFVVSCAGDPQQVRVILDIAHNEAAIKALVRRTQLLFPNVPIRVVLGMSADKAIPMCLPALVELLHEDTSRLYCTQAAHPRAIAPQQLRQMINDVCGRLTNNETLSGSEVQHDGVDVQQVLLRAIGDAVSQVRNKESPLDSLSFQPAPSCSIHLAQLQSLQATPSLSPSAQSIVLVCGTAFIMSAAREILGVKEPVDGDIFGDDTKKK